jgi:cytidylate kinase
MAVITISRQLGSAGDYIAGLVASMMSYKLVNKQSIIMEAQRRGLMDTEAANEIGEGRPTLLERFDKNRSRAFYAMRSILREAANEDNAVIVGRGGHVELRDQTDVLNVRIIAHFETRIARIIQENGMERTEAARMLKQSDKERCKYVKHFFLVDCSDPELYDIVINTSKISPDAAARLIVQAARQVE